MDLEKIKLILNSVIKNGNYGLLLEELSFEERQYIFENIGSFDGTLNEEMLTSLFTTEEASMLLETSTDFSDVQKNILKHTIGDTSTTTSSNSTPSTSSTTNNKKNNKTQEKKEESKLDSLIDKYFANSNSNDASPSNDSISIETVESNLNKKMNQALLNGKLNIQRTGANNPDFFTTYTTSRNNQFLSTIENDSNTATSELPTTEESHPTHVPLMDNYFAVNTMNRNNEFMRTYGTRLQVVDPASLLNCKICIENVLPIVEDLVNELSGFNNKIFSIHGNIEIAKNAISEVYDSAINLSYTIGKEMDKYYENPENLNLGTMDFNTYAAWVDEYGDEEDRENLKRIIQNANDAYQAIYDEKYSEGEVTIPPGLLDLYHFYGGTGEIATYEEVELLHTRLLENGTEYYETTAIGDEKYKTYIIDQSGNFYGINESGDKVKIEDATYIKNKEMYQEDAVAFYETQEKYVNGLKTFENWQWYQEKKQDDEKLLYIRSLNYSVTNATKMFPHEKKMESAEYQSWLATYNNSQQQEELAPYLYDPHDPYTRLSVTDKKAADGNYVAHVEKFINGEWRRTDETGMPFATTSVNSNPFNSNSTNVSYKIPTNIPSSVLEVMSEDEISYCTYLLNTQGEEATNQFLSDYEAEFNRRIGYREANELIEEAGNSGNFWGYVEDTAMIAGNGLLDGTVMSVEGVINAFSADGLLSSNQYKQMYVMQAFTSKGISIPDLEANYKAGLLTEQQYNSYRNLVAMDYTRETLFEELKAGKINYEQYCDYYNLVGDETSARKGWYGVNYSAAVSTGNYAIPMLLKQIPVVGEGIGTAWAATSSFGNAKNENYSQGIYGPRAWLNAGLNAAVEVLPELFGGGINPLKNSVPKSTSLLLKQPFWKRAGNNFVGYLKTTGEELFEELGQNFAGMVVDSATGKEVDWSPEAIGSTFKDTVLVTPVSVLYMGFGGKVLSSPTVLMKKFGLINSDTSTSIKTPDVDEIKAGIESDIRAKYQAGEISFGEYRAANLRLEGNLTNFNNLYTVGRLQGKVDPNYDVQEALTTAYEKGGIEGVNEYLENSIADLKKALSELKPTNSGTNQSSENDEGQTSQENEDSTTQQTEDNQSPDNALKDGELSEEDLDEYIELAQQMNGEFDSARDFRHWYNETHEDVSGSQGESALKDAKPNSDEQTSSENSASTTQQTEDNQSPDNALKDGELSEEDLDALGSKMYESAPNATYEDHKAKFNEWLSSMEDDANTTQGENNNSQASNNQAGDEIEIIEEKTDSQEQTSPENSTSVNQQTKNELTQNNGKGTQIDIYSPEFLRQVVEQLPNNESYPGEIYSKAMGALNGYDGPIIFNLYEEQLLSFMSEGQIHQYKVSKNAFQRLINQEIQKANKNINDSKVYEESSVTVSNNSTQETNDLENDDLDEIIAKINSDLELNINLDLNNVYEIISKIEDPKDFNLLFAFNERLFLITLLSHEIDETLNLSDIIMEKVGIANLFTKEEIEYIFNAGIFDKLNDDIKYLLLEDIPTNNEIALAHKLMLDVEEYGFYYDDWSGTNDTGVKLKEISPKILAIAIEKYPNLKEIILPYIGEISEDVLLMDVGDGKILAEYALENGGTLNSLGFDISFDNIKLAEVFIRYGDLRFLSDASASVLKYTVDGKTLLDLAFELHPDAMQNLEIFSEYKDKDVAIICSKNRANLLGIEFTESDLSQIDENFKLQEEAKKKLYEAFTSAEFQKLLSLKKDTLDINIEEILEGIYFLDENSWIKRYPTNANAVNQGMYRTLFNFKYIDKANYVLIHETIHAISRNADDIQVMGFLDNRLSSSKLVHGLNELHTELLTENIAQALRISPEIGLYTTGVYYYRQILEIIDPDDKIITNAFINNDLDAIENYISEQYGQEFARAFIDNLIIAADNSISNNAKLQEEGIEQLENLKKQLLSVL